MVVARLVHRSHREVVMTLPTITNPSPVVAAHRLFSCFPGLSSKFSIRLNEEDAWILSRGLLLVRSIRYTYPPLFALIGFEQLLATYSESVETSSLNANSLGHLLNHLSQIPISRIVHVGEIGITGMLIGQSTGTSMSPSFPCFN